LEEPYTYDVQIEMKLTKYEIQNAVCEKCGETVAGQAPSECRSIVNYGNTVRTLCVLLTNYASVGIDKTHKILHDLLGMPISTGTIKNIMREFASKTDDTIAGIKKNLLNSPILHVDETGLRVSGRTQWIHVASNSKYTLITAHKKRGKEGSSCGGVVSEYTGTMIHDCWKAYFGFDKCKHALCCAHLLRELNALIEIGQHWAFDMKSLLLEMKDVVARYKNADKIELSRYYREKFKSRYDEVLANGASEVAPSPTRAKSKAENLMKRLKLYHTEVTRFMEDFDVPFDNNQAERDIRNVKVKQKVSGSFRTDEGAEDFAKTSSVIGTTLKLGRSVLDSIRGLFAGQEPELDSVTE